jgi:hypothetical protein
LLLFLDREDSSFSEEKEAKRLLLLHRFTKELARLPGHLFWP